MRAERAEEVAGLDELVEAALVDEVVARRDLRGLAGGVDVLLADGAVGAREVLDALQEERKRWMWSASRFGRKRNIRNVRT